MGTIIEETFEDVAEQQGWDLDARLTILRRFVEAFGKDFEVALTGYAKETADVENKYGNEW